MDKWICRIHGESYTKDVECNSEIDAEAEAYLVLGRGVRYGNRIYPNTTVTMIDIIGPKGAK
jgi:hypothetical protein